MRKRSLVNMADFTDNLKPSKPDGPTVLAKERSGSSLSVDELAKHLLSANDFLARQDRILKIVQREPLFSKTQQMNLSRPDRYHLGLARGKLLRRLWEKYQWNIDDYRMAEYLVDDVSPFTLHMTMFETTIREQASDSQRAYWLPKAEKWEIIGAYAQTELGHGSNVKGLELEAKWCPKSKGFVLHSPTLTASKWWNGTLGRTANHAIVVAQLMLPKPMPSGKKSNEETYISYGPHSFIVQVRDMETHLPLDGIAIGDIGTKYGYAPMDNAYMLFNKFWIPHSALLSRYSSVDPVAGVYRKPERSTVIYGSLTYVRSTIVMHARLVLARAVTVAVRYTAIRRQFKDRDGDGGGLEIAVLDYPTVQIRLLPLLATAFALHYSGQAMGELYQSTRKNIESGDFSASADLHSTSSGLKSLCTTLTCDGIETCRLAMGGHGFGGASGLVQLKNDYSAKPTVEGDNWMITQQVASYLIKKAAGVLKSSSSIATDPTDKALKDFLAAKTSPSGLTPFNIFKDNRAIVDAFHRRAAQLSFKAHEERMVKKRPWNTLLIQLHQLSQAQSQAILVANFFDALSSANDLSPLSKQILWDLFSLFSLYTMNSEGRQFFNAQAVSNEQLDMVPEKIMELMGRIRPHAINIVDAWMIPDYLLDSALGRSDGRVYEDLFNRAHRLNPLNKITFNPNYKEEEIVKGSRDGGQILSKL